jgi:hypothetical protein
MDEYKPHPLSAVFVWVSCLIFMLAPGIYGVMLYSKFFQAISGISQNDPIKPLFGLFFIMIPTLVALIIGMLIGGIVWTLLLNTILPLDAARYWASYPTPNVPILTPFFNQLNHFILKFRARK